MNRNSVIGGLAGTTIFGSLAGTFIGGFFGLTIGLAAGGILGLLLAPKSGKQSRDDITKWLKDKREQSAHLVDELRDRLPEQKERFVAALKAGKDAYCSNGEHKKKKTAKS